MGLALCGLLQIVRDQIQRFPNQRTVVLRRFAKRGCQERQLLTDLFSDFCLDFGISHRIVSPQLGRGCLNTALGQLYHSAPPGQYLHIRTQVDVARTTATLANWLARLHARL